MLTFGAIFLLLTLGVTVLFTALLLPVLKRHHLGQRILEIGPSWHKSKEGTPTMGGLGFLCAITVTGILGCVLLQGRGIDIRQSALVLFYAIANGLVGITDDVAKLRKKKNEGLLPWQKLLLQAVFAAAFLALLHLYGIGTTLPIPYTAAVPQLGFFFDLLFMLFLLGTVNFVNLTDGIDGLAAAVSLAVGIFFLTFALLSDNAVLLLPAALLCGGCGGFLFFNIHPAKLFMGDTGSLFLGALIAGCGMVSGSPLLLLPAGLVFYLEGASVVLQVLCFRFTKKRLFRMAPLHHHFEKAGFGENRILLLFLLISSLGGAAALGAIR